MQYYSTRQQSPMVSLKGAIEQGLAPDRGLYMPERIDRLPDSFFNEMRSMSLTQIAQRVAQSFFGEDIPEKELNDIVADTLSFEIPLRQVEEDIWVLELFHGPTFAFKDVGARFMARMLAHFVKKEQQKDIHVLVATSGDTGSAVANGFLGVEGIRVYVLYPSGKVSDIQEAQFTTLGQNITALEVEGTFDDCQTLVKNAFMDEELNSRLRLTSANSINVARFLPQSFYYFHAWAQLKRRQPEANVVISVPSGNLGNLTAGLFAKQMGLPVKRFIAANNRNDVFREYLLKGTYSPRPSVQTIANAMDVGAPSNFDRILDLYKQQHQDIIRDITAYRYNDEEISGIMGETAQRTGYLLDPHGACGYMALKQGLQSGETGIFLATAHPAKFKETVEKSTGKTIELPERLASFMQEKKETIKLRNDFNRLKKVLFSLS